MLESLPGSQTAPPDAARPKDNNHAPFSILDISLPGLVRPCFVRNKRRSPAGGVLSCSFVDWCERYYLHQIRLCRRRIVGPVSVADAQAKKGSTVARAIIHQRDLVRDVRYVGAPIFGQQGLHHRQKESPARAGLKGIIMKSKHPDASTQPD